jgi:hypothetical protein
MLTDFSHKVMRALLWLSISSQVSRLLASEQRDNRITSSGQPHMILPLPRIVASQKLDDAEQQSEREARDGREKRVVADVGVVVFRPVGRLGRTKRQGAVVWRRVVPILHCKSKGTDSSRRCAELGEIKQGLDGQARPHPAGSCGSWPQLAEPVLLASQSAPAVRPAYRCRCVVWPS